MMRTYLERVFAPEGETGATTTEGAATTTEAVNTPPVEGTQPIETGTTTATTEQKPDEQKAADTSAPAPVTADQLTIPEGFALNEATSKAFLDIFNSTEGTPQDRANALVKFYTDQQTAQVQAWIDRQKADGEAIKNDPEIGGANFGASETAFAQVLKDFGTPELIADLNQSGLANKLSFAKFLVAVSKVTSEGKPLVGAPTSGGAEQTAAQKLYPEQGKV
jgi:hypothetical protein